MLSSLFGSKKNKMKTKTTSSKHNHPAAATAAWGGHTHDGGWAGATGTTDGFVLPTAVCVCVVLRGIVADRMVEVRRAVAMEVAEAVVAAEEVAEEKEVVEEVAVRNNGAG